MSRLRGRVAGPRTPWKPGDVAFRVDDDGTVHETVVRSEPVWMSGHWSVKCDGVVGTYLESRFYRRRHHALVGGYVQRRKFSGAQ